MKNNKGNSTITAIAVLVIAGMIGGYMFLGIGRTDTGGVPVTQTGAGVVCPDDGKRDLGLRYIDAYADNLAGAVVDYYLYEDGGSSPVASGVDTTSTSATNYTVLADKIECGKSYTLYLGDETEEYYKTSTISKAVSGAEVDVEAKDGGVIGTIAWTGYEAGTSESPLNVTLGSGESTSDLEIRFKENTANKIIEARDGIIVWLNRNDTAWDDTEVTGFTTSGTVDLSPSKPAVQKVACPDVVDKLVTTGAFDQVCYRLNAIRLHPFSAITLQLNIEQESGIDCGVDTDGGSLASGAIEVGILDENYYYDAETGKMVYGYGDEDDADIGATGLSTEPIYCA